MLAWSLDPRHVELLPGEKVSHLRFLNGQGEQGDLLQGLDLQVVNERAQFSDGEPLLVSG